MSEELKLCPFCGSEAEEIYHYLRCSNYGCFIHNASAEDDEWNNRSIERQLQKEARIFMDGGMQYKTERDDLQIKLDKTKQLFQMILDGKPGTIFSSNCLREWDIKIAEEGIKMIESQL
jgi:hypothetical protein